MVRSIFRLLLLACWTSIFALAYQAQTTAFTYQGRLNNGGVPANGSYEMQFKLFGAVAGGVQVGDTVTDPGVTVINGSFAAELDFGAAPFDGGAQRYLEISVRPAGNPDPLTVLSPRQQITSAPFAIQARNAATADNATNSLQLGGIDASEYVTTAKIGNTFIKNDTEVQTANFNVSGNGMLGGALTANTVTSQTGTGFYGLKQTDGATTVGTYVGLGSGAAGGWFGTQTNSPLHLFTNNGQPRITIDTIGSVGIDTFSPSAGYKLDVNGHMLIRTVGSGGTVQFGSPSGESGMTIIGTNRADIRFDGTTLKLLAGTGTGAMASTNGININPLGNVGIGTTTPTAKLYVEGGTFDGIRAIGTGNGVYGQSTASGNGVTGFSGTTNSTNAAVAAFNTGGGNAIYASSAGGNAVYAAGNTYTAGNARQDRGTNGLVKAMIYVFQTGTIIRCYNGMSGSSGGNCGFSINHYGAGRYEINFGFQVDDRFVSVSTPGTGIINRGVNFSFTSSNTINVYTFQADQVENKEDHDFMIIVY